MSPSNAPSKRSSSTKPASPKKPSSTRARRDGRQLPQHDRRHPRPSPQAHASVDPEPAAAINTPSDSDPQAPASPAEPAPSVLVLLSDIDPENPFQRRRFPVPDHDDPEILSLARSIRAKGVYTPVHLRSVVDGDATVLKLLAGERRWRASRLQLPELDEIGPAPTHVPAIIHRDLTDADAATITALENLGRSNLRMFEEVETVAMILRLRNGDTVAAARELGQHPSWVARRARIHSDLSEAWRAALNESESPFWSWTLQHVEVVATIGPLEQAQVLRHLGDRWNNPHLTVRDLRRLISEATSALDNPPFDVADHTLVPEAGACLGCKYNSATTPMIWDSESPSTGQDLPGGARCLSPSCFQLKSQTATARNVASKRDKHPDLVLVSTDGRTDPGRLPAELRGQQILSPGHYQKSTKKTPGARLAVVVSGPGAGNSFWVDPKAEPPRSPRLGSAPSPATSSPGDDPAAATLASRMQKHLTRRIVLLTRRTAQLVEAFDASSLDSMRLLALAGAVGTSSNAAKVWASHDGGSTPWRAYHKLSAMPLPELASDLWNKQLVGVITARLQYQGPSDCERLLYENRQILTLIGQDPDVHYREIAAQLPEPKSWHDLDGYVPEVLADLTLPSPSAEFLARDARLYQFAAEAASHRDDDFNSLHALDEAFHADQGAPIDEAAPLHEEPFPTA